MKIFFTVYTTTADRNAEPMAIGMVDENGRTFYGEFTDFKFKELDQSAQNVINLLKFYNDPKYKGTKQTIILSPTDVEACGDKEFIADNIASWLYVYDIVELWGAYITYDWMAFCDLWGDNKNIPCNICKKPFDIATIIELLDIQFSDFLRRFGNMDTPYKFSDALHDAILIKTHYDNFKKEFDKMMVKEK